MPEPKKEKKTTNKGPTPYLSQPKRDEKIWTYAENRLLDQITKEVMFAWRDDLIVIRKYYDQVATNFELYQKAHDSLEKRFPKIEAFVTANKDFLITLPNITIQLNAVGEIFENLSKAVTTINDRLKHLQITCDDIRLSRRVTIQKTKKKWWGLF